MASKHEEISLTFEKGLVTEIEDSVLETGMASELTNWEPTAQGGLRARNSWGAISTTGLPTNYKVRGWGAVATSSGGGLAIPSIVQEVSASGIESGNELQDATQTATLNSVTTGNILVAVVSLSSGTDPVVDSVGYTVRAQGNQTGSGAWLYTKTSTGGTESFTISGPSTAIHVHLFELSGVTSEVPVDTFVDIGTDPVVSRSVSLDSPATAGIAIILAVQESNDTFANDPNWNGTGTTQFDTKLAAGSFHGICSSKIYTASPVTDTYESTANLDIVGVAANWDALTESGTPAQFYILLAVATSTGYSIYRILRDSIQAGTWELVDSETSTDTSAFVSMGISTGELVWSASTMSNPRHVVLSTLVGADTADLSGKAGRTVVSHKDRVFVGGSTGDPSRLYFSGIGTPHTFTTSTDFLDIGGDDGEAIEDLISVEGLLLVCKVNRLYLVSGSGIESFFVNELPGGSTSTGRAAVRTPYGTIVAGPSDIWVVQGGGVDPLSRSLGADYSISGLVSTAYGQDIVLIADSTTGTVFRVNLVTGSWSKEAVTEGENEVGHLFSLQGRLYYGVMNSATQVGGTRRLSSVRSYDFTGGTEFLASTGRLSLKGPQFEYTPRWVYFQLRNQGGTNRLNLLVESETDSRTFTFDVTEAVQRFTRGIGAFAGAEWLRFTLSADSSSTAGAIDIEKAVLGVDMEAPR